MTTGSDTGQMAPMVDQVEGAFRGAPARGPGRWRLRFAPHDRIDPVGAPEVGGTGYAPVPKPSDPTLDRHAPKPGDGAALAAGRRPRATEQAKTIAKGRAATAGRVKALARGRGPVHRLVRGLDKLKAIASWRALAHDVMRAARLRAAVAQPA
ncbi:MAG TPA: hypothetical protein VKP69_31910 [Isosphaeraceae bacterium]|nr:hypothetical protein [Isosphaeraceae bacterium]